MTHPVLGAMRWSEDEEAWVGSYQGFHFSLGYEGHAAPSESLTTYAIEAMDDRGWLESTLAEAREQAVRAYESYYTDEIRSLTIGALHFHTFSGRPRILAELEPGRDFRCWRVEYDGRRCEGIGFDD